MKKTANFILITISNMLFCFILMLISSFVILKFKFYHYEFITYLCLLITGIFSSQANFKEKKLLNSFISSTILFLIYLIITFVLHKGIIWINSYFIVAFNIYLGAFVGCVLSTNKKPHKKGRFKKWNTSKL